jgi:hypothetical protein
MTAFRLVGLKSGVRHRHSKPRPQHRMTAFRLVGLKSAPEKARVLRKAVVQFGNIKTVTT